MKSVRQLHDTAERERTRATSLHAEADAHRRRADDYDKAKDWEKANLERDAAQKLVERASQHEQTARDMDQEAANLEQKAIGIERKEQELQTRTQAEIDKLEGQKTALRGE